MKNGENNNVKKGESNNAKNGENNNVKNGENNDVKNDKSNVKNRKYNWQKPLLLLISNQTSKTIGRKTVSTKVWMIQAKSTTRTESNMEVKLKNKKTVTDSKQNTHARSKPHQESTLQHTHKP